MAALVFDLTIDAGDFATLLGITEGNLGRVRTIRVITDGNGTAKYLKIRAYDDSKEGKMDTALSTLT